MKNIHCSTWIMARKLKILENETRTLYDLDVGRKVNTWKRRREKCMSGNMSRNTEKHAN